MKSISSLNINANDMQKVTYPIVPYKIFFFAKRTKTSRLMYKEFVITIKNTHKHKRVS